MGDSFTVFTLKYSVYGIIMTYLLLCCKTAKYGVVSDVNKQRNVTISSNCKSNTTNTPESNPQPRDTGVFAFCVLLLDLCQKLHHVSHLLCSSPSKNSETAEGRKRWRHGRSIVGVRLPTPSSATTTPRGQVISKEQSGLCTRSPHMHTSGSSPAQLSSSTYTSTRLPYTLDESCGQPATTPPVCELCCHGYGKPIDSTLPSPCKLLLGSSRPQTTSIPDYQHIITVGSLLIYVQRVASPSALSSTRSLTLIKINGSESIRYLRVYRSLLELRLITIVLIRSNYLSAATSTRSSTTLGSDLHSWHSLVPSDKDESDTSENKGSEKAQSATATHRNSSISGRRPLRSSHHSTNTSSSSSGDDDGDEEENGQRRLEKCKNQCETSAVSGTNTLKNTTNTEPRTLANPILEMSLLQSALSKVWDVTRNISLFGNQQNSNLAHSTKIDLNLSVNGIPSDQTNCSFQDLSLNVSCNKGDLGSDQLSIKGSISVTPIKPFDKNEYFSGIANPDIIPVSNQTQRTIVTPLALKSKDRRSVSNYLTKSGPYEVPPSALIKRRMKSKINQRRMEISPISTSRKRWSSESDASDSSRPAESIGCHRIRQSGRYDCSIGLKNYIYFEHDFLDLSDTRRLDKSMLFKALMTALDVAEDTTPDSEICEHSVNLSWDPSEVDRLSKTNHLDVLSHNITTKNCLLYLLSRINNHTSRVIPDFRGFNGLHILHLSELDKKVPLEHRETEMEDPVPLVILHIGASKGLNLIPRKFNRRIVDVYDIQLENFSLLIESSEAYSTMETSLASESSQKNDVANHHIVIQPCMIKYASASKPSANDHTDPQPKHLIEDVTDQRLRNSPPESQAIAQPDISESNTCGNVDPVSILSESMSAMSLTPEIRLHSPPPDTEADASFVTPPTNNKKEAVNQTRELINPETTPVSTRDSVNKAKNLRNFLRTPEAPHEYNGVLIRKPGEPIRRKSFSCHSPDHPKTPLALDVRRRHASEGEDLPKKSSNSVSLHYKRYDNQEDGVYNCGDSQFYLTNKFLKKVPKTIMSRQKLLEELKQSLLDISPEITPGQSSLSHADITWETTEMEQSNVESQWCALKTMVNKISQQVIESTNQDPKFNGVRLIYASDRSVKMTLRAISNEKLPLAALHIGQPRDLSIAPKKYNPDAKTQEIICDIRMGNYSLIVLPKNSSDNLNLFFATQKNELEGNDEQLLLIPFYERDVTTAIKHMIVPPDPKLNMATLDEHADSDP